MQSLWVFLGNSYGAFKSCRINRIYKLNAHEHHHKVIITSGKLEISFKPKSDAMDAAKDYIYAASVLTVDFLKLIKVFLFDKNYIIILQ